MTDCKTCGGMDPTKWMATCETCSHSHIGAGRCLHPYSNPMARAVDVRKERNCLLHSERPKVCPDCEPERISFSEARRLAVENFDAVERGLADEVDRDCTAPASDDGGGGDGLVLLKAYGARVATLDAKNKQLQRDNARLRERVRELEDRLAHIRSLLGYPHCTICIMADEQCDECPVAG